MTIPKKDEMIGTTTILADAHECSADTPDRLAITKRVTTIRAFPLDRTLSLTDTTREVVYHSIERPASSWAGDSSVSLF